MTVDVVAIGDQLQQLSPRKYYVDRRRLAVLVNVSQGSLVDFFTAVKRGGVWATKWWRYRWCLSLLSAIWVWPLYPSDRTQETQPGGARQLGWTGKQSQGRLGHATSWFLQSLSNNIRLPPSSFSPHSVQFQTKWDGSQLHTEHGHFPNTNVASRAHPQAPC